MAQLTVDDLKKGEPIFVKSAAGRGAAAGDVIITCYGNEGRSHTLIVPKTYIPIRLTDQAPSDLILNSPDFRRAVSMGLLIIVPVEEALEELASPDASREMERLRKDTMFKPFQPESSKTSVTPLEAAIALGGDSVSARVKDMMLRSDLSDDDRLAFLRADKETLTQDDFKYILLTVDSGSALAAWAKKHIED